MTVVQVVQPQRATLQSVAQRAEQYDARRMRLCGKLNMFSLSDCMIAAASYRHYRDQYHHVNTLGPRVLVLITEPDNRDRCICIAEDQRLYGLLSMMTALLSLLGTLTFITSNPCL